jgi:serine/threonine protein kinase
MTNVKRIFSPTAKRKNTLAAKTQGNSAGQHILPSGTIIGGTFRIISVIGLGGMGVVYLAEHAGLKRRCALKILASELVNEKDWLRFQGEAKTLAGLTHPTLVKVYDLGIHDNHVPFYAMDYLPGRTLETEIIENGPISLEFALKIFIELLDGLAYAHRHGIIHRDIKPGNIMLCRNENGTTSAKILDFGIAKLGGAASREKQNLTSTGEIFGSPYYMSPEQCIGLDVDARSDIYSLGCTLFESLTGFVPFEAETPLDTVALHEEGAPPTLAEVDGSRKYPASMEMVVARCLSKRPEDRYQSAKEMAIDLIRVQEGKDLSRYSMTVPALKPAIPSGTQGRREGSDRDKKNASQKRSGAETDKFENNYDGDDDGRLRKILIISLSAAGLILTAVAIYCLASQVRPSPTSSYVKSSAPPPAYKSIAAVEPGSFVVQEGQKPNKKTGESGRNTMLMIPKGLNLGRLEYRTGDVAGSKPVQGMIEVPAGAKVTLYPGTQLLERPDLAVGFGPELVHHMIVGDWPKGGDAVIAAFSQLKSLQTLRMAFTDASDASIEPINKLSSLRELDLHSSDVTPTGLSKLNRLQQFTRLTVGAINKGDIFFNALKGSKRLEDLTITSSYLTANDIEAIVQCPNIESLAISTSRLPDASLEKLNRLTHLRSLTLRGKRWSETALTAVAKMKGLKRLTISSTQSQFNRVARLIQDLPQAKVHITEEFDEQ